LVTGIRDNLSNAPVGYLLLQNYPNPFNPATTIKFSLPQKTHVSLSIYNSMGQEVTKLISKDMNAGVYTTEWNASGFASGVYYYRIVAGNFTETKKLLLLK
jgi:flagellar hook assembly protein FlgD